MKNFPPVLLVILFILSCSSENDVIKGNGGEVQILNMLSDEEIAEGWELLFDGKSFAGWRGIGIESVPEGHWKIEDGTIKKIAIEDVAAGADGQPFKGGDLITDKSFDNFELKFEWKISEAGNSGIKYNVIEEVSIKNCSSGALGYEYQFLDDARYKENLSPVHSTAALYDLITAVGKKVNPVGTFNSGRIVFNGSKIEHWLNGARVVVAITDSPEFQELFKKSKYHDIADFTLHKDGHIVLQDHGDDCWYRNIKIRQIN